MGGYQPPESRQRSQQPGGRVRVGCFSSASGGGLFTAEKSPKRAGGCGPRTPLGLRGVHPKERHRPGRYAPPGCPVPYCPPLPGFARASRIGQSLRLQGFSLRPHELPRNVGYILHTAADNPSGAPRPRVAAKPCRPALRPARQAAAQPLRSLLLPQAALPCGPPLTQGRLGRVRSAEALGQRVKHLHDTTYKEPAADSIQSATGPLYTPLTVCGRGC